MFAGPLFHREVLTTARQPKHYLLRFGYVVGLAVVIYTAGQATFGWQQVRTVSDTARFGQLVFQTLAFVQLILVAAFALLFAAANVAQEKDRRTLVLLLMTDLRNRELVLGKTFASLLTVVSLVAVSLPVLTFVRSFGGITLNQVFWVEGLCLAVGLAAGSWGNLVAFWRDKTFQTLAISAIGIVLFLGLIELLVAIVGIDATAGQWIAAANPFRALVRIINPFAAAPDLVVPRLDIADSVIAMLLIFALCTGLAITMVRRWNPSQTVHLTSETKAGQTVRKTERNVWTRPIIWREIRTRAYGRKVVVIKAAFLVFAAVLLWMSLGGSEAVRTPAGQSAAFGLVALISLLLINAQAVTSITTERDGQTLELLLVTNVSVEEFVFGKLGGALYNAKEVILAPLVFVAAYAATGSITLENFIYVSAGYVVLVLFATMLGLHFGFSYGNSRSAIAGSLGTLFFLFIGTIVCMMLIVEARNSFALQFTPFLIFILGGSLGLWSALTYANPSPALTLAAAILPFCTFYAITGYLLGNTLGVCLFVVAAYGFTTIAMLIPAVSEFDVALGRTTLDKG